MMETTHKTTILPERFRFEADIKAHELAWPSLLPVTCLGSADASLRIPARARVFWPTDRIRQLLARLTSLMTKEHGVESPPLARANTLNQRSIAIPP